MQNQIWGWVLMICGESAAREKDLLTKLILIRNIPFYQRCYWLILLVLNMGVGKGGTVLS